MANTEFQPSLQHTAVEINASSQGKVTTGASFERGKETSPTSISLDANEFANVEPFDPEPEDIIGDAATAHNVARDNTSNYSATTQEQEMRDRDAAFRRRVTRDRDRRAGIEDITDFSYQQNGDTVDPSRQDIVGSASQRTDAALEITTPEGTMIQRDAEFRNRVAKDRARRSAKVPEVPLNATAVSEEELQHNIYIESQPLTGGGQVTKGDAIDALGKTLGSTRSPEGMIARAALRERGIQDDPGWHTILARARLKLGLASITDIKQEKDRLAVKRYTKDEASLHDRLSKKATQIERTVGDAAEVVEETVRQREGGRYEPVRLMQQIQQVQQQIRDDRTVLTTPRQAPGIREVGVLESLKTQAAHVLDRFARQRDIERNQRKLKMLAADMERAEVNNSKLERAEEAATSARETRRHMTDAAEGHARARKQLEQGQLSAYLEDQIRELTTTQFMQLVGGNRADLKRLEVNQANGEALSEQERVKIFRQFSQDASPAFVARRLAKIINRNNGNELLAMHDAERDLPEYMETVYRSTYTTKQERRDNRKAVATGLPMAVAGMIYRALIKD